MGWSYPYHTKTRSDIVAHIFDIWSPARDAPSRILRSSLVGNHLWMAMETTKPSGNSAAGKRWIALYLLQGDREGWGCKDISESMGPSAVDCPLVLLRLVPDPGYEWDDEPWRDRVRAYHAGKSARRKQIAGISVGDIINFAAHYGNKRFRITGLKPLSGVDIATGDTYRIPPRALALERS